MNPESNTQTDALILQLVSLIKDTKDFTVVQMPEVAHQILVSQWINTITGIFACSLAAIISFFIGRHYLKVSRIVNVGQRDTADALYRCSFTVSGTFVFLSLVYLNSAFHLYFAPKAVVLEALLKMVNH